jgi:ribosomal protein S18 acetylase RimI-like enzyme
MIGTLREARGQGYGRILLEYVHAMSERDPDSRGVSLTTEDPANVSLYESFGYEITGHARVSADVETWAFYRPNDGRERGGMS